ncbi:methyltransferase domain protein (macronuclear) [Tetrahymena thermophila SB210]|uniref:Methyltransferase domain protein n=1 Tax=Tetrahymena thermophila (strain SB210) TaxID=312017 RepID=I7MD03_TETTS|nr:methyltransferase domain protein [Tetrahymena thermophila SB210]EAR85248.3 methyltransferase domain protein [Tetrahymena thermophila SB210]|eukprot:XP_001032911.3 methyltransferase domain protein [Tetrahymena thermophila SB210]
MNIQQNQLQDPPHNSSHYGKIEYWEKRYQTNTKPFDWYQNYDGVKDIITQYINKSTRILNVGCGSSLLSEEMYFEGYKNITNVDYSNNLIKHLVERYSEGFENTFKFEHCDVRNMKGKFANNSFDCVIDKGTLDSVLCGEYSRQNSFKMLSEISRVLTQDGVYMVVTYGEEKKRQQLLENNSCGMLKKYIKFTSLMFNQFQKIYSTIKILIIIITFIYARKETKYQPLEESQEICLKMFDNILKLNQVNIQLLCS